MTKQDLIEALQLSGLAYGDTQPEGGGGALRIIDDPETDVQCYLRRQGDCLTITFRGSNSDLDWAHNLQFHKMIIPYGNTGSKIRVHSGFLGAYKCPRVRGVLHEMMTPETRRVHISGHSYGAALSLLCAVDLQYNFPDRDYQVIVFGCPRVGNNAFRRSYNKRLFKTLRVENGNDIVTKVPFALMGFRHVGACVHIGAPRLPVIFSFEQHRPERYLANAFRQLLP